MVMDMLVGLVMGALVPLAGDTTPQPAVLDANDTLLLARNIYFEARGEPVAGQAAVAQVVLNRLRSPDFPNSVADVIYQNSQFSWTIGSKPRITDQDAWLKAIGIATLVQIGQLPDLTQGAEYFFAPASVPAPSWAQQFAFVDEIGSHKFYRRGPHPALANMPLPVDKPLPPYDQRFAVPLQVAHR